jgi:hypothetical protein
LGLLIGSLLSMAPVEACFCEEPGASLGVRQLTVTSVTDKKNLDALIFHGNARFVRQAAPHWDKRIQAYMGPDPDPDITAYFLITRENKQWSVRRFLPQNQRLVSWLRQKPGDDDLMLVKVAELPAGREQGIPIDAFLRVAKTYVIRTNGKIEELDGDQYLGLPYAQTDDLTCHTVENVGSSISDKAISIHIKQRAPFPNVEARGVSTTFDVIDSDYGVLALACFDMWQNAGRSQSPSLKHYWGYGVKVAKAAGEELKIDKQRGLPSDLVSAAWVSDERTVYVGFYDEPAVCVDLADYSVVPLRMGGDSPKGTSMIRESAGLVLIGTFADGLYAYDVRTRAGCRIREVPKCRVNEIRCDSAGAWVATSEGLFLVSSAGDRR